MRDDPPGAVWVLGSAYGYSYGLFWRTLYEFTKPVIAAVRGYTLGGGWELAHLCHFIVAGDSAVFGAPAINVGLIPFAMSPNYLANMVGKHRQMVGNHRAMYLLLNAKRLSAAECLERGAVNTVVPNDRSLEEAMRMAHDLASRPPLTVSLAKQPPTGDATIRHCLGDALLEPIFGPVVRWPELSREWVCWDSLEDGTRSGAPRMCALRRAF